MRTRVKGFQCRRADLMIRMRQRCAHLRHGQRPRAAAGARGAAQRAHQLRREQQRGRGAQRPRAADLRERSKPGCQNCTVLHRSRARL